MVNRGAAVMGKSRGGGDSGMAVWSEGVVVMEVKRLAYGSGFRLYDGGR